MNLTTSNYCLTFLLILWFSGNIFAQKSGIEKLRHEIAQEANDTNRIKRLIRTGLKYGLDSREQLECFREVCDLSKKANYRYGLVYCSFYEALYLWSIGRNVEALEKYQKCIHGLDSLKIVQLHDSPLSTIRFLFDEMGKQKEKFLFYSNRAAEYKVHGPKENLAPCYHGIAGYYSALGDCDKAIEYYIRARDCYYMVDPQGFATEGIVIGGEYLTWGNFEKAEFYLQTGLKEKLQRNEYWDIDFCYNRLGDLYMQQHEYKRAFQYYFTIKKYWPELPPPYIVINLVSIAAVHLQMKATDSALFYLREADGIRRSEQLPVISNHGPLEVDYYYYHFYQLSGDYNSALRSLKAALKDAQAIRYNTFILKYTNELHSFLLQHGDSLGAFRYLSQYHALQDSLNTMNTQARIASFEIEQQQQLKENEIEQLQTQKTTQRNYYLTGGAFLLMVVIGALSRLRYKRKRDKEQLTTDFKKQLAQAETIALRAQMNPHFIFNCLNSINSFVMEQKHEIASEYLIKFSKLIRLILDNSRSETISVEKELETLKLYVQLESARFDNKFQCVYNISEDLDTNSIMIPPMLLQPFVENAIWHGLMQKEGEGTISIEIKMENEYFLSISITDDGIGREKAAQLKSKSATHKSHGLKVTTQRIEMMNKLNSTGAQVHVIDLKDERGHAPGTRVELLIPV